MRLLHVLRSRVRSLFLAGRREADLREEMQLHIDHETERLQASGMTPTAARQQALRHFGGLDQIKEACRDARGTATVDALMRDTRHGLKRLGRDWKFTMAVVLILGLGIGANTAVFSVVNMALLRQQALAAPDRLVEIYQNVPAAGGPMASSYPAYQDMAAYTDIFASTMAASPPMNVNYRDSGAVRPALGEYTTATYLAVLGLRPALGRWFNASEDAPGAAIVAVLGHQAWTRKFLADPSVVGRTIRIEGLPVTIVGVGPVGHDATLNFGLVTDFWLPISVLPEVLGLPQVLERSPNEPPFFVKARLRDGVTVAQARAAMNTLGARLKSEYPKQDPGAGISVFASNDVRIHPLMDRLLKGFAAVVLAIVGLVLAIACSNLATLLLLRGTARAKEVSIRLAVGATRRQLIRLLLIESLLLSLAGGAAGCFITWSALRWLSTMDLPIVVNPSVDYRVLLFAVALSLVTGVAFGLAPALHATRIELVPTLRDDGQTRSSDGRLSLKNALVVFQVAVSVLLLGGASFFFQLLNASRAQPTGYAIDGIAMLETDVRYAGYSATDARNVYEELRRRIAAIPGVESAVLNRGLPMDSADVPLIVDSADASAAPVVAGAIWAGPGFFDTLRIPVLYGRAFDGRDREDTPPVAMVSEAMARQYFGGPNAVGRRFRLEQDANSWMEVVGVVRDTGTNDPGGDLVDPTPQLFYRSFTQSAALPTSVIARTSLDAATVVGPMQRELRGLDGTLPVIAARTMAQYLEESTVAPKAIAMFLGALGALGLLLAGIGLYSIVAFGVSRRSREIGIRMALGARGQQVVWSVARQVAALVAVGTGIGLALSLVVILALRVFGSPGAALGISLYQPAVDPVALLSIAAFMAMVGVAAACIPARRAATMDPLAALRHH